MDIRIVNAAFARVKELESLFGDTIPSAEIRKGFKVDSESILFENQVQGIFKPKQMKEGVLSIKTTMPRDGQINIYNDQLKEDGFYHYSLQTGDPRAGSNKYLWQSKELCQPFIYFHAVAPAVYKALWPCFIKDIFPEQGYSVVSVGKANQSKRSDGEFEYTIAGDIESRYLVRESNVRLHQASFRHNVLQAYQNKCAITSLPIPKLIEAAHIIPDKEIGPKQTVSNGIALNRLHHRAYDSQLLGIDPDYKIHLGREFELIEGSDVISNYFSMYEGAKIYVPKNNQLKPDKDYLARRFESFERLN